MSAKEVLQLIQSGQFVVTTHALERMLERRILQVDIRNAARTCEAIIKQNHGTWKLSGLDTSGEALTVVAAEEDDMVIVTLYFNGEGL